MQGHRCLEQLIHVAGCEGSGRTHHPIIPASRRRICHFPPQEVNTGLEELRAPGFCQGCPS
eukprot:12875961-Alexandrium_andersonii.AAC.1